MYFIRAGRQLINLMNVDRARTARSTGADGEPAAAVVVYFAGGGRTRLVGPEAAELVARLAEIEQPPAEPEGPPAGSPIRVVEG